MVAIPNPLQLLQRNGSRNVAFCVFCLHFEPTIATQSLQYQIPCNYCNAMVATVGCFAFVAAAMVAIVGRCNYCIRNGSENAHSACRRFHVFLKKQTEKQNLTSILPRCTCFCKGLERNSWCLLKGCSHPVKARQHTHTQQILKLTHQSSWRPSCACMLREMNQPGRLEKTKQQIRCLPLIFSPYQKPEKQLKRHTLWKAGKPMTPLKHIV